MILTILRLFSGIRTALRLRSELALENLALRQQLAVLHRQHRRPRIRKSDRVFWLLLSRFWGNWKETLVIAPHSPWQTPYVERVIGTLRRECFDHIVVLREAHLRRIMRHYLRYYHETRSHLALGKDAPVPRPVQPPEREKVIEIPEAGGLHHRYERRAA